MNDKQREVLDSLLPIDNVSASEDEPKIAVELTRRQLRFLVRAIDHFLNSKCPMTDLGEECDMLCWEECGPYGSIQKVCALRCEEWIDELLSQVLAQKPAV